MPEPETFAIATKCLEAWSSGDFATARSLLRDDVTFVGPLGSDGGIESYMDRLVSFSRHVTSAEPKKVLVDGDDACIIYDLITDSVGTVPASDWYHVEDGKITSVRAYFDTRAFTPVGAVDGPEPAVIRPVGPDGRQRFPNALPSLTYLPALVSAEMELADTSM